MTDKNQKQLGRTLWIIADRFRGSINADDFRDPMLTRSIASVQVRATHECVRQGGGICKPCE